jgi:Na/Pi-cotransporter
MSIWIFFKLIGALALLMFGMKSMSDSLQKMAGPQLRHVLGAMTTNRLTGILTGTFITAAVQSSTATTVMTVSFVNAGLLTLAQAISVIMGANIGTTLTAWIMSAGFTFNITDFVWPGFLHRHYSDIFQETQDYRRLPLRRFVHVPGTGHLATSRHRHGPGAQSDRARLLLQLRRQ